MEKEYDIIICGGGPSGSTCAMTFKGSSARVLVIDKSEYPREKVCGDGIAPYVSKVLHRIDESFGTAYEQFEQKFPIDRVLMSADYKTTAELTFPEEFYVSTRHDFDDFLYQQASSLPNVDYATGELVKDLNYVEGGVKVITSKGEYFGKVVLGCDGATSVVKRKLGGIESNMDQQFATVRAYFSDVKELDMGRFEVYYFEDYPSGYLWVFPSAGGVANIGFGTYSSIVSKKKLDLKKLIYTLIDSRPDLKERFADAKLISDVKGWTIPVGYGSYPVSGDRYLLLGDAVGLADPITGEGIGPAMVSGRIAGFFLLEIFEKGDYSAATLKGYDVALDKKYGSMIRKRRRIEKLTASYPIIYKMVIKSLHLSKGLRTRFIPLLTKFFS